MLDPLVESFSKKFYTFFVPYNKVLIVRRKLPEIAFLQNLCPADNPAGLSAGHNHRQPSCRVVGDKSTAKILSHD